MFEAMIYGAAAIVMSIPFLWVAISIDGITKEIREARREMRIFLPICEDLHELLDAELQKRGKR